MADAAKARQIAAFREEQAKNRALGAKGSRLTLESLQAQLAAIAKRNAGLSSAIRLQCAATR